MAYEARIHTHEVYVHIYAESWFCLPTKTDRETCQSIVILLYDQGVRVAHFLQTCTCSCIFYICEMCYFRDIFNVFLY